MWEGLIGVGEFGERDGSGVWETDVVIVGAGPVGLMLAGELRLGGVDCVVLEREAVPVDQSRALGFTARTIEVFDQRGLLPRFGGFGTIDMGHFGGVGLDYREVEGGSYGAKAVPQSLTVAVLEKWAEELGARIRRGWEVTEFTEEDKGVVVEARSVEGGQVRVRGAFVVGCDGGRSLVRKRAGVEFPGSDAGVEMSFAEVEGVRVRPRPNGERVPGGMVLCFQQGPERFRVTYYDRAAVPQREVVRPSFEEVAEAWLRLTGEDISAGRPLWVGRFTDASRQAVTYRRGRVLLAGDAAHVHLPIGGQGMSAGVQDAVNLGWKLAAEVQGWAPGGLLDSYHEERHPVGARVLTNTLAQRTLYLSDDSMDPMREVFEELTAYEEVRTHLIGMVTGLDIRYEVGPGDHPLLGRRLPARQLTGLDGTPVEAFTLLHRARGVLLDFTGSTATGGAPWADRVDTVAVRCTDTAARELFAGVGAVLVRPDGYVAWVGREDQPPEGLTEALARWFGVPAAA